MKKLLIIFCILLTGCSKINMRDYLYPISIGVDYKDEEFAIYMQLVSYSKISKKENESTYDENYEMIILKSSGKTIYDSLNNLKNITKNEISTTHIRSFIIGENLLINNQNHLDIIRAFFDNNYLRSNLNIFSTSSILDIYKTSKIIDNTPYSNEINEPNLYRYLKPMNYLNFLKNVYDNRTSYLPYIIIDKESSSYVEEGKIKENYIIEINGAYFVNNKYQKYLTNDEIIGNYYFINRDDLSIEIKDKFYVNIRKLKHSTKYKDKIIFNIDLINCTFYLNNITYNETLDLLKSKIKEDINFTYNNCYDEIDIFNLNDYKNRYNINNNYEININVKYPTINYSDRIK